MRIHSIGRRGEGARAVRRLVGISGAAARQVFEGDERRYRLRSFDHGQAPLKDT